MNCFGFDLQYGYEYLGPSECITHTPSTDRHIVSTLLALKQYQAGCLYGASNSGKTRTVAEVSKVRKLVFSQHIRVFHSASSSDDAKTVESIRLFFM